MRCPQCGTENPEDQANCIQCSAPLIAETSQSVQSIDLDTSRSKELPTKIGENGEKALDEALTSSEPENTSEADDETIEKTQPVQIAELQEVVEAPVSLIETDQVKKPSVAEIIPLKKQTLTKRKPQREKDNGLGVFFIALSITFIILILSIVVIFSLIGDQLGFGNIAISSIFNNRNISEAPLPDNEIFLSGPLVLPADTISTQNAEMVRELTRIGKGWLGQVIFSPDGQLIIAPASLGVYFLNGNNLSEVQFLPMEKPVFRAAYSPDGSLLALAVGYEIQIYILSESRLIANLVGHENTVSSVSFSPDGKYLLSSSWDRSVRLWQVVDGSQIYRLRMAGEATSVAFSPDGSQFMVGLSDKTVGVFETGDGAVANVLRGHEGAVLSVTYSPDGKWIATGGNDKMVKIWNKADGKLERTLTWHDGPVLALQFSPDGKKIATASSDNTIRIWSVPDGKPLQTLDGHASYVYGMSFSPDGKTIASTSTDGTVCLWGVEDGIRLNCKGGFTNYIYTVSVSENMSYLAFGDESGKIQLLNLSTGAVYPPLRGHKGSVRDLAFFPASDQLISASSDGTIRQWMLTDGSLRSTLAGHEGTVNGIDVSSDGAMIVSCSGDGTIRLWNANDGSQLRVIESLGMPVNDVIFSSDQSKVLSGGDDRSARLWDVATGDHIAQFRGQRVPIKQVLFNRGDADVLSADVDDLIRVWDTASQKWKASLVYGGDQFDAMALSPDGSLLAVAVFDQLRFQTIVELYRVEDQSLITRLTGHTMPVSQLQFSPDGRWLISASEDGTIRFWGVQ